MYGVPETLLIERLAKAGVTRRTLSRDLKKPYSTISAWLNGLSPLPKLYRHLITVIIDRAEKAAAKA